MGSKAPLADDEVLEIVRLHEQGMLAAEIAPKFKRAENTIRSILTGKSYRSVTCRNHRPGPLCDCLLCVIVKQQEANVSAAEATTCDVRCMNCRDQASILVTAVLRLHGQVLCASCDPRRK